jgi:hypothetical protein
LGSPINALNGNLTHSPRSDSRDRYAAFPLDLDSQTPDPNPLDAHRASTHPRSPRAATKQPHRTGIEQRPSDKPRMTAPCSPPVLLEDGAEEHKRQKIAGPLKGRALWSFRARRGPAHASAPQPGEGNVGCDDRRGERSDGGPGGRRSGGERPGRGWPRATVPDYVARNRMPGKIPLVGPSRPSRRA